MNLDKKKLIRYLEEAILDAKRCKFNMEDKNWGFMQGTLISYQEAELFLKLLKKEK